jgi:hypothetical protein
VNKFLIRHAPHATYSKVMPYRDISPKILMWFNDFFVPFIEIFSANFTYKQRIETAEEKILVETEIKVKVFAKEIVKQKAEFLINAEGFEYFKMTDNNQLKYTAFRRKD